MAEAYLFVLCGDGPVVSGLGQPQVGVLLVLQGQVGLPQHQQILTVEARFH